MGKLDVGWSLEESLITFARGVSLCVCRWLLIDADVDEGRQEKFVWGD